MTSRFDCPVPESVNDQRRSTIPTSCHDTLTWDNENRQSKPNHRSTGKGTIHESV